MHRMHNFFWQMIGFRNELIVWIEMKICFIIIVLILNVNVVDRKRTPPILLLFKFIRLVMKTGVKSCQTKIEISWQPIESGSGVKWHGDGNTKDRVVPPTQSDVQYIRQEVHCNVLKYSFLNAENDIPTPWNEFINQNSWFLRQGKRKAYSPEIRSPYGRPKSAIPASQDCIINAGPTFHVTIEKVLGNQSCPEWLFQCILGHWSNPKIYRALIIKHVWFLFYFFYFIV